MRKIRVLIVDDSVVIRRMLTDILSADPEIEVAGTAPNGKIALAKLPQINPDLVTLDIEMPELDGLNTLPELRKAYPKLPVIMFSTLTERGASATLEALSREPRIMWRNPRMWERRRGHGNSACATASQNQITLPVQSACCDEFGSPRDQSSSRQTAQSFAAACRLLVDRVIDRRAPGIDGRAQEFACRFPGAHRRRTAHAAGVYAHLANRLNQECALEVHEASAGMTLRPGHVLIAPGDYHLELCRQGTAVKTVLTQGPPENSCRPAVDVTFRSAAALYGPGSLAVVLTGMGQDGLRGGEHLVRAGGKLLAQDEATSVVWGMPRAVAQAG